MFIWDEEERNDETYYHCTYSDYNNLVVRLLIGIVIWYFSFFCLSAYLRSLYFFTIAVTSIYIYTWLKKIRGSERKNEANDFRQIDLKKKRRKVLK